MVGSEAARIGWSLRCSIYTKYIIAYCRLNMFVVLARIRFQLSRRSKSIQVDRGLICIDTIFYTHTFKSLSLYLSVYLSIYLYIYIHIYLSSALCGKPNNKPSPLEVSEAVFSTTYRYIARRQRACGEMGHRFSHWAERDGW